MQRRIVFSAVLIAVLTTILPLQAQTGRKSIYPDLSSRPNGQNMTVGEIEEFIWSIFGSEVSVVSLAVSFSENDTRDCKRPGKRADGTIGNINGTIDWGIYQMNSAHIPDYPMYDFKSCEENILAAYTHYKLYGWTRWMTYNSGAYRQHLDHFRKVKNRIRNTFLPVVLSGPQ